MRAVPFLLLALLLALPAATAQLPTNPVCGPIQIPNAPTTPGPVPRGSAIEIVVTVTNAGQVPATVTVTAAAAQAGWQVSAPEPATIEPGQRADFRSTVTAGESASEDATISFSANGTCPTPQGVPCPGSACNAGSVNTQVLVPLEPDDGFTFPGMDALGVAPELLIAGVVLIGLASAIPFAMRRRKSGLVAECPEPLKMLKAGRGTSFPIEIRNPAKEPTTAQFEVAPVPEGWSAFMPLPEVQLAARESRSLWLMVRAPQEAKLGDAVDIELRLRDPKRGVAIGSVRVRAEVQAAGEG